MANSIDKHFSCTDFKLDTCCFYDHNYDDQNIKSKYRIIGNYVVFGNPQIRPWIMCFGGSTTSTIQGSLWAQYLHSKLQSQGLDCAILNGGCGGHNSWNELNKMMRDLPFFKPDIVISYSGINDYAFHADINNPYVNIKGTNELLETRLFSSLNYPPFSGDHSDAFITRSRYMNSVCQVNGSKFLRILQPTLGFGDYKFDLDDKLDREFFHYANDPSDLLRNILLKKFYSNTVSLIDKLNLDFICDGTKFLDGCSRSFADYRHPNSAGYDIIAGRISQLLFKNGYLAGR